MHESFMHPTVYFLLVFFTGFHESNTYFITLQQAFYFILLAFKLFHHS